MDNIKWLKEVPIAHRGLHCDDCPENSIKAFENAIDKHYAIELDIQLLKDGNIAVFHDNNLKRMTGIDRPITECTIKDIEDLRLNNSKLTIPLLNDVLSFVNGRVPLLIEIKNYRYFSSFEDKLCKILKEYKGSFAIQSFNPFSLMAIRKKHPEFARGQLSCFFCGDSFHKQIFFKYLVLNFATKPNFISYCIDDLPFKKVEKLRKKGLPILGWTINSYTDLLKAKSYCDNMIFENVMP